MIRTHFSAVLLCVVIIVFGRGLAYPFLSDWDDGEYVLGAIDRLSPAVDNVIYWFTHFHAHNYYPLTMLSYMVDYRLWGTNPFGYHLQSLLWHVVASTALYSVFLRLRISPMIAAIAVLVFAVHPQRVESVVWISERKDVMCTAFYLLAFDRYLAGREAGKTMHILPYVLWVAALLSKAMAITLPAVLVLYEMHRSSRPAEIVRCCWPYWLPVPIIAAVSIAAQGTAIATVFSWSRRLTVVPHNLMWYFETFLAPTSLSPLYPRVEFSSVLLIKASVVGCLLIGCLLYLARRHSNLLTRTILPLVLSYLCIGAPVIGVFSLGAIDYADRYSYLMSTAILLTIAGACTAIRKVDITTGNATRLRTMICSPRIRRSATVLCIAYAAALGIATLLYIPTFRSNHDLWLTAALGAQPNPYALGALAEQELMRKNYQQVMQLADELESADSGALTEAHKAANSLKAKYLRASVLLRLQYFAEAAGQFEALQPYLDIPSTAPLFRGNDVRAKLGECYRELDRFVEATALYDEILRTNPSADDFLNRGVCYFNMQQYEAAAADFQSALALDPDYAQAAGLHAAAVERLDDSP